MIRQRVTLVMQIMMNESKRNRAVARAVALLSNEGYTLIAKVDLGKYHFATLRHQRSKNVVCIKADDLSIKFYRNGKLYKEDPLGGCEVCQY